MPFSKENIRFTVLVIGFTFLCMTAITSITVMATRGQPNSTPLIMSVISFVALQAGQLVIMIRVEQSNKETIQTRHDLKEPLQQIALQEKLPCTKADLKLVVQEVMKEIHEEDRKDGHSASAEDSGRGSQ